MAGVPATTASIPSVNGGVDYGGATLPGAITSLPGNIFQGTGVNGLTQPTWYQPQTFTPTDVTSQVAEQQAIENAIGGATGLENLGQNNQNGQGDLGSDFNAGTNFSGLLGNAEQPNNIGELGNFGTDLATLNQYGLAGGNDSVGTINSFLNNLNNSIANEQNSNVAGYDAANTANANGAGYLQQAAIAQNQLLGELNQRGLLQSYENGGMGTADMSNLSNQLQNAQNDQGVGLQNELSGLTNAQQQYDLAQSQFENSQGQFSQQQQDAQPGLTDILGLGVSGFNSIKSLF